MKKGACLLACVAAITVSAPADATLTFHITGDYSHAVFDRGPDPHDTVPYHLDATFTLTSAYSYSDIPFVVHYAGDALSIIEDGIEEPASRGISFMITDTKSGYIDFGAEYSDHNSYHDVITQFFLPKNTPIDVSSQSFWDHLNVPPSPGGYANGINIYDDIQNFTLTVVGEMPPIEDAGPSGIPEPASWATGLLGFGAIGAAIRKQRKVRLSFG